MGKQKFSLEHFQKLHKDLQSIKDHSHKSKSRIIEILKQMAEILVWSEQNNQNFFDYFMSSDIQSLFTFILKNYTFKEIAIQLIQTANILAHNLSENESKQYLLSTQFYGEIISWPFDFGDDELVENYISLLKGLAVNLNVDLLRDFVINKEFRLYSRAFMFLNYQEPMIRTGARTVILNIFKIPDEQIKRFVLDSGFFASLVSSIREQWIQMDKEISEITNVSRMDSIMIDNLDNLYYVNDIFELGIEEFSQELADLMLRVVLLPIVVGGLASFERQPYHLSISLSTYLLIQTLQMIKYPQLLNTLISTIFLKEVRDELLSLVLYPHPLIIIKREKREFDTLKLGEITIDCLKNITEPVNFKHNTIRQIIISFLQSRDDTLITLILLLLDSVMWNELINKTILKASGLLSQQLINLQNETTDENNYSVDSELSYDREIVHSLLNLMTIKPPLRLLACQLLSKIVINLTYRQNIEKCLLISDEIALNQALRKPVKYLKKLLTNNSYNGLLFLESFEEEWQLANRFSFNEHFTASSSILIRSNRELAVSVPLHLRHPEGDIETTKINMYLFFLYRKIRFLLCKSDFTSDIDINVYPLNNLRKLSEWKIGEHCGFGKNYIGNRTCLRCWLKEGKTEVLRYIIEDENYFIIVDPDISVMNHGKIIYIANLRNVEATVYNSERQTLVLAIKQKKDSLQISLSFEDQQRCAWAKNMIESHRKVSKDFDLGLIQSMLDSFESNLKIIEN